MPQPSLLDRILSHQTDPKASKVLLAGYEAFLAHGLRRTSMQDIADRAGMSRAALYQHFKNKDDIYSAMMGAYFAAAIEAVEEVLAGEMDVARALDAAFDAQIGDAAEALIRSPHAEELLSDKHAKAGVIVAQGTKALARVYARWLAEGAQTGRISPDIIAGNSERTALVMMAALDGLKGMAQDWPAYLDARKRLARLFGRALTL